MIKEYGYEQKSLRLHAVRSGKRGKRLTVLAALNNKNQLVAPFVLEGHTNKIVFCTYLEKILLPQIKGKNKIIILDNASFHKGDDLIEIVKNSGNELLFLPPYSPDLNPIEKKWAQIKSIYRRLTFYMKDKPRLLDYILKKHAIKN